MSPSPTPFADRIVTGRPSPTPRVIAATRRPRPGSPAVASRPRPAGRHRA